MGDKGFTPRLAKKWTWAPDSMSIAFSLDPRARWHDGKPVTANDVRYTLQGVHRSQGRVAERRRCSRNIDSVSVRDSLTPVVWFKKRTPEQFYDVAYQLLIMPEHVYGSIPLDQLHTSEITDNADRERTLSLREMGAGRSHRVDRRHANYRGRAKLDRVHHRAGRSADGRDAASDRPSGFPGRLPHRPARRARTAAPWRDR